ncbi:MAG: lytic transglycosylase domain-containing protein [Leptospirales bacterium]|nr:lytic transglycosylase domain-containing protein [Leptospirales bacterium]
MVNGINNVMDRIDDIQKRFGLKRHNIGMGDDIKPSADDFDAALRRAFGESETAAIELSKDIPQRDKINKIAERYAHQYKVPSSLVKAMIEVESGYDMTALSPKGAMGLMQLMPATAASLGVEDPFSPEENIRGGVTFLRDLLKRYDNDYKRAVAAYNAGPGAVDRYGGIPEFRETKNYVDKVLKLYNANR